MWSKTGRTAAPIHRGPDAPPFRSRIAAFGALVVCAATLGALTFQTTMNVIFVVASFLFSALGISALWIAGTNRRFRWGAGAGAVLLLGLAVASLVVAGRGVLAVIVILVGIAVASGLGTVALRWEVRKALAQRWQPVPAVRARRRFHEPQIGRWQGGKAAPGR